MSKRIVVLGCYEHTLTIARSLARAGHQVILGVTPEQHKQGFVHRSRSVASTWTHPDIVDQPAAFDSALLAYLAKNTHVDVLFPVGEDYIRRVACVRDRLPHGVNVVMPSSDAVYRCLNQQSSNRPAMQACSETGVFGQIDDRIDEQRSLRKFIIMSDSDWQRNSFRARLTLPHNQGPSRIWHRAVLMHAA